MDDPISNPTKIPNIEPEIKPPITLRILALKWTHGESLMNWMKAFITSTGVGTKTKFTMKLKSIQHKNSHIKKNSIIDINFIAH